MSFRKSGFTLIELLVVVAVVLVLAVAVIVGINPAKRLSDANDTKARSDVALAAKAVESCLVYVDVATLARKYVADCNNQAALASGGFARSLPVNGAGPNFQMNSDAGNTVICISQQIGSTSDNWKYYTVTQNGHAAGVRFIDSSPCLNGQ